MFKRFVELETPAKAAIAAACSALAATVSAGTAIYQANLATANTIVPYKIAKAQDQGASLKELGQAIAQYQNDLHKVYSLVPFRITDRSDVDQLTDADLKDAATRANFIIEAMNRFALATNTSSMTGVWPDPISDQIGRVYKLGLAAARCHVHLGQFPNATRPEIWANVRLNAANFCINDAVVKGVTDFEQEAASLIRAMKAERARHLPESER